MHIFFHVLSLNSFLGYVKTLCGRGKGFCSFSLKSGKIENNKRNSKNTSSLSFPALSTFFLYANIPLVTVKCSAVC